jgi:thiamine transport system ATP-binding protein
VPTQPTPALRIEGVEVRFGDFAALAGIDLEVRAGERLAVLGPSGSGKSTLLRAIAGLEPLAAGRINWAGRDLAGVPVHRRGMGLMFQDYALFPQFDVAGNVAFGLRMRGDAAAGRQERVDEVLELVGLAGYGARRMTELSGGEQQRVALARALAPEPRLLMLDEPLGALDRALRTRLLDELAELFGRLALTIIYVTHDQEEALALADRVALLNAGRLAAVMPPDELWLAPPSEFAARFLGFDNIFSAEVDDAGVAHTPWGALELADPPPAGRQRLFIRPTGIRPAPAGNPGTLLATVVRRTFRGDHVVVWLAVEGGDPSAPPLVAHVPPPAPAEGERVNVLIDPSAIVLLGDRS